MVDLTKNGLDKYWGDASPVAPFIVASMDAVEDWVLERDELTDKDVVELFAAISSWLPQVLSSGKKTEFINDLLVVLAYLHTSKALRVVHWMADEFPEFDFLGDAGRLYNEGEISRLDRVAYKLLIDRLRFVEKTTVLQTVFAPERMAAVQTVINQGYR